jgi:amino acid permease
MTSMDGDAVDPGVGTMPTDHGGGHEAGKGPVADAAALDRSMDLGQIAGANNMSTSANPTHANNTNDNLRQGTIVSAVLNILSTMVGGGSLSLPLAFAQAGIGLVSPVTLVCISIMSYLCMSFLAESGRVVESRQQNSASNRHHHHQPAEDTKGTLSYELLVQHAFGSTGHFIAQTLVSVVCFFATVGYSVLLRDLLEPYADYAASHFFGGGNSTDGGGGNTAFYKLDLGADPAGDDDDSGPTLARNLSMMVVVLIMTPFCLLTNLTALKNVGLLSMVAVLILGCIIVYRSAQCNLSSEDAPLLLNDNLEHQQHHRRVEWSEFIAYLPSSVREFITAFPIFISCYICHYNVPPIVNELQDPTPARVSTWLRMSVWTPTVFYLVVGFAGSMYGNCTKGGTIPGNILLAFDEDDVLLLIGRSCLALTIALAFPMLVIPPRDIVLRSLYGDGEGGNQGSSGRGPPSRSFHMLRYGPQPTDINDFDEDEFDPVEGDIPSALTQPLLLDHVDGHFDPESPMSAEQRGQKQGDRNDAAPTAHVDDQNSSLNSSTPSRALVAVSIFWLGASIASCVKSIDIVWDLLGSSLSLFLGFIIPCATYLKLCPMEDERSTVGGNYRVGVVEAFNRSIKRKLSRLSAWFIISLMIPMCFVCTANAIYNTFFAARQL